MRQKKQEEGFIASWRVRLAGWPYFVRHMRAISQENTARDESPGTLSWQRSFRVAGSVAIILGLVWFFAVRIGHYFDRQQDLNQNPLVYNLTKAGLEWDVFYGRSPMCGDHECLLTADYPAAMYQKRMVLPAREFPLKDYKSGDVIYLRTFLEIPEFLQELAEPISFQSVYIWAQEYKFYVNGTLLEEGSAELLNITLPSELVGRGKGVHIALRIDPGDLPYQGLAHRADLLLGPKSVLKETIYDGYEATTVYFLWFILPKLTFSLVFALLFLAVSRHKELFAFIIFAFLTTADAFFHSKYPSDMLPPLVDWQLAGLMTRCFVAIAFMRFIHDFFRRKNQFLLRFQTIASLALAVYAVCGFFVLSKKVAFDSAVLVSESLRLVSFGYAIYTSFLMFGYLSVTQLSRFRQRVALCLGLFYLAALVPVALDSGFKIFEVFGIAPSWSGLNLTGICELILFMALAGITAMEFGMTVSAKDISQAKLETLEERLELGRAVQQLLLPRQLTATMPNYGYRFYHEPAEKMSGDWINIWCDEATGERRLIFGDVVGKGPQAALAVSAIASLISDAKIRGMSMEECFHNINQHLLRLFAGQIYSTVAAIVVHPSRKTVLYNCGAMGWIVLGDDRAKVLPMRSSPLGMDKDAKISHAEIELERDMIILTFTDGCLEGSRSVKRLLDSLRQQLKDRTLSPQSIVLTLDSLRSELGKRDDRTALIVAGDPQFIESNADGSSQAA